jgi:hypothetical protein
MEISGSDIRAGYVSINRQKKEDWREKEKEKGTTGYSTGIRLPKMCAGFVVVKMLYKVL